MRFNFRVEDIKYIKILYRDKNGHPNILQAALHTIDANKLYVCAKMNPPIDIVCPQEITLSIICADGLYRTKTALVKLEDKSPYVYLTLDLPQNMEYQQNREYFRIAVNMPCKYIYLKQNTIKEYPTSVYNISAGGISIILNEPIISDEDCKIMLTLSGQLLSLNVQYVRSEKINNIYRMSFAYTNISERDRDIIAQTCIKQQLSEKRKYIS